MNSTDGVPEDQLESFLGVDGSAIDAFFIDPGSPGFAFNGSAMKITLDVVAGDTISFDWYFDGGDEAPFLDSSFVLQPDGLLFELADVGNVTSGGNEPLIRVGDFGDSGWQTWNWTVQQTGTIQIGFGVVNDTDNENNSALYIDNVTLVKAQNHLVDADDDLFTTAKNSVLHANVLADDFAPDGVFSVTLVPGTEPEFGTLELNNDGTFSFDPGSDFDYLEPGEIGLISFDYEVTDTNGDTDIATANITVSGGVIDETNSTSVEGTATVTVTGVNDAPIALDDSYVVEEDKPLNVAAVGVLGNDTDVDSATLTAALATGPSNGALTLNADGSFSYTPAADFNGTDSFTYLANDGSLNSNTATVSINVNPVNDPPVALDDFYVVDEDHTLNIGALPGSWPTTRYRQRYVDHSTGERAEQRHTDP